MWNACLSETGMIFPMKRRLRRWMFNGLAVMSRPILMHKNIKSAGRWVFNVLAGVSLLLCLATTTFLVWAKFTSTSEIVYRRADHSSIIFDIPQLSPGIRWLIIDFSFLPALWIAIFKFQQWKRKRSLVGICLNCGYDLRASPDRCPECRTVPKGKG